MKPIDKLKDKCQFCKHYLDDMQVMNCAKIYVICKNVQSTWELHTDIAEAMQPETTELKIKCTHPRESRQYIGRNMLRCGICGYEFE